ncbi:hypothetical protein D9M71_540630 [compost metagenome]
MHVFEVDAPVEVAGLDLALDGFKPIDDGVALGITEHADLRQHGGMGDRTHDVVAVQALVEIDRGGETGDEGVDGLTEAAAPGLIGLVGAHGFTHCRRERKSGVDDSRVGLAAAGRRSREMPGKSHRRISRNERQCSTDRLQLDKGLAVNLPGRVNLWPSHRSRA